MKSTYTVGDEIPTAGESYKYPDNFDIIVLRDWTAVKVRNRKITEIISADNYSFGSVSVINGRGFEVRESSEEEVRQFLREYSETAENGQEQFFAKWLRFDTYRKVAVRNR